ncbi:hypothetical protein ACIQPR_46265 [Streptomyces sp. NPDC091280]|uniref:hypothetical protein n=1 Tax=Streptomyces sp. NPDC091280 TaxID=3365984 RepID=UPI0038098276
MRCGAAVEELASDVMGELPTDAQREIVERVELVRSAPDAWLDVRDPGSVEEFREVFGARC